MYYRNFLAIQGVIKICTEILSSDSFSTKCWLFLKQTPSSTEHLLDTHLNDNVFEKKIFNIFLTRTSTR